MNRMMNIFALSAIALALFGACQDTRELPPAPATFVRYASGIGVPSQILHQNVSIAVLLPADYVSAPERRYGVVYLLHGLGDTHKAWNDQWLRIENTVAQCEAAGLEDMIYVMPSGFRSYYVNRADGNFDYMRMFVEELVPYVDKTYRTIADRDHRAVVGYSMGGFGAMILPSKHPETFGVSVPLSMSFRTDEQYMTESASGWDSQWGAIFGGKGETGEARLTDYYKEHCPFYMFTEDNAEEYSSVAYYFDCGDDEEQLLVANDRLHEQMRRIDFRHEYRVRNGAHTGDYWRGAMPEALRFIESRFESKTFEPQARKPYEAHKATRVTRDLQGSKAEIFLPAQYDAAKQYSAVYLLHDGHMPLSADEVMNVLAQTQNAKPFVMIAADATASGFDLRAFIAAAEKEYSLAAATERRICVAYGNAGMKAYAAANESVFGSLFTIDAAVDTAVEPAKDVFYFITTMDEGDNYAAANFLYERCHAEDIGFEYRVTDGSPSDAAAAERCIESMRPSIGERIKLN